MWSHTGCQVTSDKVRLSASVLWIEWAVLPEMMDRTASRSGTLERLTIRTFGVGPRTFAFPKAFIRGVPDGSTSAFEVCLDFFTGHKSRGVPPTSMMCSSVSLAHHGGFDEAAYTPGGLVRKSSPSGLCSVVGPI